MRSAFRTFGLAVVRFRFLILAAWIAFGVVCFAFFPSISSVAKDQNSGFLPANSPSIRAEHLASTFQNIDLGQITLVGVSSRGALTAADQSAMTSFETRVKSMPRVVKLQDFGTSPDGQAREAQIEARVPINGTGSAATLVKTIRREMVAAAPPGMAFHLAGDLPLTIDLNSAQKSAGTQTNILSVSIIIILLLLAFRAALAPLLTIMTSGVALVLGQQVIAETTKLGVQVNSITSAILTVLVLGAGTDYAVFLLFRMREEVRNGLTPREAVARAIATVGEPITFSALTVVVALLSLQAAQFGFYQALGMPLAIGIGVMLVAGLTFFPSLLAIFGRAAFWPSGRKKATGTQVGWWGAIAERVIRFPLGTLIAGLAVFVALALGNLGVSNVGFGGSSNAPAGSDSAAAQAALQTHYAGTSTFPEAALFQYHASVWQNPAPAVRAQQLLAGSAEFKAVSGPFAVAGRGLTGSQFAALHRRLGPPQRLPAVQTVTGVSSAAYNAYRFTAQFISPDGHIVQFLTTPRNNNVASAAAINAVPSLRGEISTVARGVGASQGGLFGYLAFSYDINSISGADLHRIIPIVAVLIAILLAVVLRSLTAPVYLVVSVVLSYLAALGLAGLIFVHFGGQSGLNFVLPFIMFIFLMALGSDYNILVMSRIREEAERNPMRVAVRHAVGATGTTITTAGMILGGTFAVLGFTAPAGSNGDQLRQIGYGIAAGILMDTFLVRTLLVPAIATLLGRWTWWPSHLWSHPVTEGAEGARSGMELDEEAS